MSRAPGRPPPRDDNRGEEHGLRLYDSVKRRIDHDRLDPNAPLSLVPFLGPYFVRRCADRGITSPRSLLRFLEARVGRDEGVASRRAALAHVIASLAQNRRANRCVAARKRGGGTPSYWVADVNARAYCALFAAADLALAASAPSAASAVVRLPGGLRSAVEAYPPRARLAISPGVYPAAGCACRASQARCEARGEPAWAGACVWLGSSCQPANEAAASPMAVPGTSGHSQSLPWPAAVLRRGTYDQRRHPAGSRVAWRRPGPLPEVSVPPEVAWLRAAS